MYRASQAKPKQKSTIQYNTVQYNTVQYSDVGTAGREDYREFYGDGSENADAEVVSGAVGRRKEISSTGPMRRRGTQRAGKSRGVRLFIIGSRRG